MKQAIILAAGLGSRLKEITKVTPKSLIEINDQPILERNIEYMIEAQFDRIIIILGYMKEKFFYLKDKYPNIEIQFVINEHYKEYNTIYSLYCARNYLNMNSYICTADIFLQTNLYKKYTPEEYSFYVLKPFAEKLEKEEWIANLENNRIISVNKHGFSGHSYCGISYWTLKDLEFIKNKMLTVNWDDTNIKKAYWDELLLDDLRTHPIYSKILEKESEIFEIDDFQDLQRLKTAMRNKVSFIDVSKDFGERNIFKHISFDIKSGEVFVLVGPSGSGKSTLLKMINKMVEPDEGTILLDGKNVNELDTLKLRKDIGYMMQKVGLFPHMTCRENILLPFELSGKKPDKERLNYLIEKMDLTEELIDKYPNQLSGGEKQRVGLVRALSGNPDLVLMDEAFSALDPVIRRILQNLVIDLHEELNTTFIVVTHDMEEALKIADRICFIKDGVIEQIGTPYEIVNFPKSSNVKEFFYRGK